MKNNLLAFVGALVGGLLGYLGFFLLKSQGFYAMVMPGGLLGIGAAVVPNRSIWVAVVCGVLATALGFFTEYRFTGDLSDLTPVTLGMIAAGGFIGFWCPFRRKEPR
jgi:hypothetical protein